MESQDNNTPDIFEQTPVIVTLGLVTGALAVSGATLALTSFGAIRAQTGGYIPPETVWAMIGGFVLGLVGLGLFMALALYLRKKSRHSPVC